MWRGSRRRSRRHRGERRRGGAPHRLASAGLTLDTIGSGRRVRIVRISGGRRLVHRLAALGLVPGAMVTVRRGRGPAIVSLDGIRLAVGRHAAMAIEVEEASE